MSVGASPQQSGELYLYLIEIADVGVKVGVTRNPTKRLASHDRDARAFKRAIGRTWVSPVPHINAAANESAIKGRSDREYLARTFDDCVVQARQLPLIRATASEDAPITKFLCDLWPSYGQWLREQAT